MSAQPYAFDVKWQGNNVALGTQNVVIQDGKILFGGFSEFSDFSASPTITNSNITLADVSSTGGDNTITLPNFFHSALGGSIWIQTNGDISTGKLSASSVGTSSASEGGHIEITSAGHVLTKSINLVSSPNFTGNSSLTLNLSGPSEFVVGSPTNHGIDGTVNADVVQIFSQNGDVNVPNPAAISNGHTTVDLSANNIKIGAGTLSADAYSGNYSAGTIYFIATNSLSISADITANGAGANSKGGSIYLYAPEISLAGSLTIAASGSGAGNGGNITGGGLSNLSMGGTTNILASGGLAGGSGGRIRIDQFSAYQIIDSGSSLNMLANGNGAGSGGRVQISSADVITMSNANIYADASSLGSGDGGTARMQAASFVLQKSSVALHADGGQSGNGGNIFVASTDANANLQLDNNFLVSANSGKSAGSGGNINISSGHDLKIKTSAVNAAVLGSQGNGGNITATAANGGLGGTLSLSGNLSVDGKDSGNGGNVSLTAAKMEFPDSTARLISANGGSTGNGGYIEITASDPAAGISLGNNSGAIRLSATGGSLNSPSGDGGTIHVRTGGDLTVRPQNVNVASRGSQGNGGNIQLLAGFKGSSYDSSGNEIFQFNDRGTLTLLPGGTLNASAKGAGTGGSTDLQGALVNVRSNLNANGGQSGNGGQINVSAHGAGNSLHLNNIKVSAAGGSTAGSGGNINISSDSKISITGGSISVSSSASGNGNGGTVSITDGVSSSSSGGALTLTDVAVAANAGQTGNGGKILVQATGAGHAITLSGNSTILSAKGGTSSGDGGNITVNSPGKLSMDGSNLNASARGNGNGGTITLSSADTTSASMILPSLVIRADAAGTGNGGTINITSAGDINSGAAGTTTITARGGDDSGIGGNLLLTAGGNLKLGMGALAVDAYGSGNAGVIELKAFTDIGLKLSKVTSDSYGTGSAGHIVIQSAKGGCDSPSTIYSSSAKGANGDAGTIDIETPNGTFNVNGTHADASGDGVAGTIFVDPGDINYGQEGITATGSRGNGVIFLQTTGNINILGPVKASKDNLGGVGGVIFMQADGNIKITSSVDASGNTGFGGFIIIFAHHNGGTANPFIIGEGVGDNGISGPINASGFKSPGTFNFPLSPEKLFTSNGIAIEDGGTGGINIKDAGLIKLTTSNDNNYAGLFLSAPNGKLVINGALSVNGGGSFGAGAIVIKANELQFGLTGKLTASSTNGTAGLIDISANNIGFSSDLTIEANGMAVKPTGQGTINIIPGGNVDLQFNYLKSSEDPVHPTFFLGFLKPIVNGFQGSLNFTGATQLTMESKGPGQGGTIAVVAGQALNFSGPVTLVANATGGTKGNGGSITLGSEFASLSQVGHISLSANGRAGGESGIISLLAVNPIKIAQKDADAISISNSGGRSQNSAASDVINVSVISQSSLNIDGAAIKLGAGANNGSHLKLEGTTITVKGVLAAESSNGSGGKIEFVGQSDSGSITIAPQAKILVNGATGGGIVSFLTNSLQLTGASIEAKGTVAGAGGKVFINEANSISLGSIDVSSVAGAAGSISIIGPSNPDSKALTVSINGSLISSMTGGGADGRLILTCPNQDLTVDGAGLIQPRIEITAHSVHFENSNDRVTLTLQSVVSPSGEINIVATGSNSKILLNPGGAEITGKSVYLQSQRIVCVDSSGSGIFGTESVQLFTHTDSNGNILLGSNISSNGTISVAVHKTGKILQNGTGSLKTNESGNSIFLSAEEGAIGNKDAPILIETDNLNISSEATNSTNSPIFVHQMVQASIWALIRQTLLLPLIVTIALFSLLAQ